ncbi:toll-like receptor 7 [Zootoca vivipara]|uniref:toll-like receptor 7 n=1 Tax=Zootoca vivipara TaxID=8524 RepID=UPI0015900B5B|nr:toll-like receptor 7 [Zootoca vivipara]
MKREGQYLCTPMGIQANHLQHTSSLLFSIMFITFLFPRMVPATQFPKTLPCDMVSGSEYLLANCSERGLVTFPTFPQEMPANITNLTLAINHIPMIAQSYFDNLKNLLEIDFRCNCVPPMLGPKNKVCTTIPQIKPGSFAKLHKLKSLYLDGNRLSAIPLDLPSNLRLLSLEANHIFSLNNLSGLSNLESLFLGQNCYYRNPCNVSYSIDATAFQALGKLTVLSLKANNISKVPENLPSSLMELYLYNNVIRNISGDDLASLRNLKILDLSGNCPRCHNAPYYCVECEGQASIFINSSAFDSLTQLEVLRLHSTSLRRVDPKWFKNTMKLKVLDLSQNYLAKEIECAHFLKYLPNLVSLDLSFNFDLGSYPQNLKLPDTFSTLTDLQFLGLRGLIFWELNNYTLGNLIPLQNLNVLDFGTNFIRNVDVSKFKSFPALKVINLSFNKISLISSGSSGNLNSLPKHSLAESNSVVLKDMHYFRYDEYGRSCKCKDREAAYPLPFAGDTSCSSHGAMLDLSRNNMFFIKPSDFKDLTFLKCLNLSANAMSQTLNGTEFKYLSNLKYLDFSNNRIDLLNSNAFKELEKLEVLDLSDNSYYFKAEGITHMLGFIGNLINLKTLFMNGNEISTSTDKGMASSSLTTLEFRKNRLNVLWQDGNEEFWPLFKNLTSLKTLDVSENSLTFLPLGVFNNLPPMLEVFILASNKMKSFNWGKLYLLENLKTLDLSNNQLTTVPRELSNCSRGLETLNMQNNRIRKLTKNFLQGASQLKHLDLSFNKIRTLSNFSFPKNVIDKLNTLVLHGNPFRCDCDLVWFVSWVNKTNVTIPLLATDVTCAGPGAWKGKSVVFLDQNTCELNYSSILYLITVSVIMSLMLVTVMSHLYFWDVWYIYHLCTASLKGYKRLSSSKAIYDAFIAYDKKDAAVNEWVLKELLEKLEDGREKRFKLCLEDRDWLPGRPVLENLSESIQESRKTVFVLTNRYISSGNFKTTFYLAHQRLVDEKADVIILVFLEKVLQTSKYLRLRKRLCNRSVLEWPTNPQSQWYFWQCLRNSLAANHDLSYNKLFKEMV